MATSPSDDELLAQLRDMFASTNPPPDSLVATAQQIFQLPQRLSHEAEANLLTALGPTGIDRLLTNAGSLDDASAMARRIASLALRHPELVLPETLTRAAIILDEHPA